MLIYVLRMRLLLAFFVMLKMGVDKIESFSVDQQRSAEKIVVIKLSREKHSNVCRHLIAACLSSTNSFTIITGNRTYILLHNIVDARCVLRAQTCLLNAQVQLKHNNETSAVVLLDSEIFGEGIHCNVYKREHADFMIKIFLNNCEHNRVKRRAFPVNTIGTTSYIKHDPESHRIFIYVLYIGMFLVSIYTLVVFLIFFIYNEQHYGQPQLPTEENKTTTQQQQQQLQQQQLQQQQQQLTKSIQQSSAISHLSSDSNVASQTASSTSSIKQPNKSHIDTPLPSIEKASDGRTDQSAKMLQAAQSNTKTENTARSLSDLFAANNTPQKEKPHMRVFRTEVENEVRSSQKINIAPTKKKLRELCGSNQQHTTEDLQGRSSFKTVRGEVELTQHIAPGSANTIKPEKNPLIKHQLHAQDVKSHEDYPVWRIKHRQTAPVQLTGNLGEKKSHRYLKEQSEKCEPFTPTSSSGRRAKRGRNFFKDPKGKSQLAPKSTRWNFYGEDSNLKNKDSRAIGEERQPATYTVKETPHFITAPVSKKANEEQLPIAATERSSGGPLRKRLKPQQSRNDKITRLQWTSPCAPR